MDVEEEETAAASFETIEGAVGAFLRVAEDPDKVVKVGVFFVVEEEEDDADGMGRPSSLLFLLASSSISLLVFWSVGKGFGTDMDLRTEPESFS